MFSRGLLSVASRVGRNRVMPGEQRCAPAAFRSFGSGGDPRAHLNPDGTRPEGEDAEDYHDPDPIDHQPKLNLLRERGQLWVVSGDPPKSVAELWEDIPQKNIPFWHRSRLIIWGNYKLLMKAEYLFFYLPTVLIMGLCIPLFTTIYALEEVVASTMTV